MSIAGQITPLARDSHEKISDKKKQTPSRAAAFTATVGDLLQTHQLQLLQSYMTGQPVALPPVGARVPLAICDTHAELGMTSGVPKCLDANESKSTPHDTMQALRADATADIDKLKEKNTKKKQQNPSPSIVIVMRMKMLIKRKLLRKSLRPS